MFPNFRRSGNKRIVERLHGDIVAAVRQPAFYVDYGVADTFDGRFELLALFSSLAVMRLTTLPAPGPDLAQALTDHLFQALDDDLREIGVGDLAVPKRIKKLAAGLLGRRHAYTQALDAGDDDLLCAALSRNVHAEAIGAGDPQTLRLASYVRAAAAALATTPIDAFARGPLRFPDPAHTRTIS